jgi:CDP-glycerol glycerophosphotransferase (TagB/SpsB family)
LADLSTLNNIVGKYFFNTIMQVFHRTHLYECFNDSDSLRIVESRLKDTSGDVVNEEDEDEVVDTNNVESMRSQIFDS